MDGLEEIKKIIKNFVLESKETKKQITEIENNRVELALKRNEKMYKSTTKNITEINELGQQIFELGNESQKLQNKLDFKFNEIRKIVDLTTDNLITEGIRKIRKIEEERQEIEERTVSQRERKIKYEIQRNEFYERFGRMPELSENARKEDEIQNKQIEAYEIKMRETEEHIQNMETELVELATMKRNFKNGNWTSIVENPKIEECKEKEETIVLPLIEEFQVEETKPIENVGVEAFTPVEKTEIGEIEIETIQKINENIEDKEIKQDIEQVDEIELLARTIVEEIIAEQTKELNINKTEENDKEQEIITFEDIINQEKTTKKIEKEIIKLSHIIAKVEDGEIIYKAQASNGEEINVYPTLEVKNILLNDKEYREEIKEILINYAMSEHKMLDNNVIKKIDPTVCEVLERFAKKYNYNERQLIYNYAMSFSKNRENELDNIAPITYNLAYLKHTNLSKKERTIISKICKKAIENQNVDVIGGITGLKKMKYIIKKIFNINSVKSLTEGKYE